LTPALYGLITKVVTRPAPHEDSHFMSPANKGVFVLLADIRVTRPNTWNLEAAGDMYRDIMGVSEPWEDYDARIEVYATMGLALRSTMHSQEPGRRVL
jgi:hypothetical protein